MPLDTKGSGFAVGTCANRFRTKGAVYLFDWDRRGERRPAFTTELQAGSSIPNSPMSLSDMANVPLTRYVPQSPKPHSPPETPSPSSPARHGSDFQPRDLEEMSHSPTTPTPTKPRHQSQSQPPFSRFTPDSDSSPIEPLTPTEQDGESQVSRRRGSGTSRHPLVPPSTMTGMGIKFPVEFNPLPAGLKFPRQEGVTETHASLPGSSTMLRTRSDPTSAPSSPTNITTPRPSPFDPQDQLSQPIARPRTTAPFPTTIQALAASSSSHHPRTDSEESPKHVTPQTDHNFPDIHIQSPDGQSPAMDGKKEPSIKAAPAPSLSSDSYEPTRRNVFSLQSSFTSYGREKFPLSEPHGPISPVSTTDTSKKPFAESTAYLLGLYFCLNLGLTLFNKVVLVSFPFPYVCRIF